MKLIIINLIFILLSGHPDKGSGYAVEMHTKETGSLNVNVLTQIERLITKKAGAELQQDSENTFKLNGHEVYTSVTIRKYAPDVYEESFYEIKNPANEYRLRLTKHPNGDSVLAIFIKENEKVINCHAAFDKQGKMYEEDPWGTNQGYTIDIFKFYQQYRDIFSKRVDGI